MIAIIDGWEAELVVTPSTACTATASSAYARASGTPGRNRCRGTVRNASSTAALHSRPLSCSPSTSRARARSAAPMRRVWRADRRPATSLRDVHGNDEVVGVDDLAPLRGRELVAAPADQL